MCRNIFPFYIMNVYIAIGIAAQQTCIAVLAWARPGRMWMSIVGQIMVPRGMHTVKRM